MIVIKKITFLFVLLCLTTNTFGQIAGANHFPTLKPHHILDENKEDISFAFGMRILESDYNGPLIRLRRASDDNEEDFYCNENDVVDINAINSWASGGTLYVSVWYDQSGLGRNAVQTDADKQPVFTPDITLPYFNSDGVEDFLVVETTVQTLTNQGKNGTVIGVFYATDNNNHTFGVRASANSNNRWLAHCNWSNSNLFFDPGRVSSNRNVNNTTYEDIWAQYTLSRRDNPSTPTVDEIVFRINTNRINNTAASQTYPDSNQQTGDFYFGIGATISQTVTSANPYGTFRRSSTRFNEFIMYAEGKEDSFVEVIEENQVIFWNL